jgi:hypothetical protein
MRKSWHKLRRQAAVLGRYSPLADSDHGVNFFVFDDNKKPICHCNVSDHITHFNKELAYFIQFIGKEKLSYVEGVRGICCCSSEKLVIT